MDEGQKKKSAIAGEWLAMGIALGVAFGIIFDNLGLWLPIGVCIGLAGPAMKSMKKNNKDNRRRITKTTILTNQIKNEKRDTYPR